MYMYTSRESMLVHVCLHSIHPISEASTSTRRCHWLHLGLSPGSTGGAAKHSLHSLMEKYTDDVYCHTETYRNYMIIYMYIYI